MTDKEFLDFKQILNDFNQISEFGINESLENWILQTLPRLMTKNYSDYQIVLENTYMNTSKKPIKEYFTVLEILNEKGDVLISLNCYYDWSKKTFRA